MKAQKLGSILFISAFLVFIFLGMLVTIVKPKEQISYYEKRALAQAPELSVSAMMQSDYSYRWEQFFNDHAAARATLVRLGSYIDLNIIGRPVVNEVVPANGVYLGFNEYEAVVPGRISEQSKAMVNELAALDGLVSSYGGLFYYVTVPAHYAWYADRYPWYMNNREEYTRLSLEAFKSDMSAAGLNLIEMGEILGRVDQPPELFSASDHHFTLRGAYETYLEIVAVINREGKYSLPLYSEEDLLFTKLENPFLGSRMRKILGVPGLSERIEIAVPKENIPFTRTDVGKPRETPSVYSLPYNQWDVIDYGVYMGGDIPETVIDTGRDLPSVLIYGDSSTNAVECLMYLSSGVFRSVDLRYYNDMPLSEYVEMYKPDIVIGIRGYEVLLEMTGNGVLMGQ